jgi:putative transposase
MVFIPLRVLKEWHSAYRSQGLKGLLPDNLTNLHERSQHLVLKRYNHLQDVLDAETLSDEDVQAKVEEFNRIGVDLETRNSTWALRRLWDWIRRYRRYGLWGLAPEFYSGPPQEDKKEESSPPRSSGSLTQKDWDIIDERISCLGDLRHKEKVSNKELDERAREVGWSRRTLRNWHTAYCKHGFLGLAPNEERSDKGQRHGSEWITEITEGICLSYPGWSVRAVHQEVCRRARRRGEPEPGLWKVRAIYKEISPATRFIADGREDDFRNGYRISGKMKYRGVTYQIDHTRVDVLVRDIRRGNARSKSGVVRPWLTLCIDSRSRLIVAAIFGYDQPNRHTVAAVLRDALLTSEAKPRGGIPRQVRTDYGKDLIAEHVVKLARGIDFELYSTYLPEHKGIVERFFRMLNDRLWRQQPGYTDSNVADRNPNAEEQATLTVSKLVEIFWKFIINEYHQEEHSETGMTPIDCWDTYCFTDEVDPRKLDTLLYEEKEPRVVNKDGIHYENRIYWHEKLGVIAREKVKIHVEPSYAPPDTVEVYYKKKWFCTAFALDSAIADQAMTALTVRRAQQEQRAFHEAQIAQARAAVEADDAESAQEMHQSIPAETPQTPSTESPETSAPPPSHDPPKPATTRKRSRKGQSTLALFANQPGTDSGEDDA